MVIQKARARPWSDAQNKKGPSPFCLAIRPLFSLFIKFSFLETISLTYTPRLDFFLLYKINLEKIQAKPFIR